MAKSPRAARQWISAYFGIDGGVTGGASGHSLALQDSLNRIQIDLHVSEGKLREYPVERAIEFTNSRTGGSEISRYIVK
jgi:hypothetical protein